LSYDGSRIVAIPGGSIPEAFYVYPMLTDQVPERPPVFLGGLRCPGDIALMGEQKPLQIGSLELGNSLRLRILKGFLFGGCFRGRKDNVDFSDHLLF
jgi:hypothetical protein